MTDSLRISLRVRSVLSLVLFFAYVLAFVFEGPAFYCMMEHYGVDPVRFVMLAVAGEFVGLLSGGLFVKNGRAAKWVMLLGMAVCFAFTCVFFFPPSGLWMAAMAVCAVVSGWVNTAWGYFLKTCTPSGHRIKSCADVLIYSNLLMILVNVVTINFSAFAGLGTALALIAAAMVCTATLPTEPVTALKEATNAQSLPNKPPVSIVAPLIVLVAFVVTITINSGLMYQMIVPAFAHLTKLTSWYWAVPYIAALFVMRNLPARVPRARALYLGMAMIMVAFVFFVLLDRGAVSYLVVDTLMLGACGIFDLFWWSILGEMLDLSDRPALVFGIGISANVFGILLGNLIALTMGALSLPVSSVTIVALSVVCVTLMLLPLLNHRLAVLLNSHTYLSAFSALPAKKQQALVHAAPPLEALTPREQEVLVPALSGKSNKAIAEELSVSENTVKTHLRNIYAKYQVSSRSELISMLLKTTTP